MTRQDALLTGIYRLLRILTAHVAPGAPLPDDIADLDRGWLLDLVALDWKQGAAEQRQAREIEKLLEKRLKRH